ncbi:MAG: hypothetical protein BMS9Abin09_0091 [Gammaproteobacteria bacterium]|nr:MAG: hypothetical protein BMS9Abin09_0091 [Gammaproteobacteria bacterium]
MTIQRKPRAVTRKKPTRIDPAGIGRYLPAFLEYSAMIGCSEQTGDKRDKATRRFIAWCDERDLMAPQEITKPILERYQRHLFYYRKPKTGEPLTFGTQVSLLVPVKAFFKWLTQHNHILYNPASELVLPKVPRQLPRTVLSVEQVEQVLAQPDINTPQGLRDRAIMETLYSTGIRRMEAARLKLYDIDAKRGVVFVREGKGRRDRYVPIGERALLWIARYREQSRPQLVAGSDDGTLFLNEYGEPYESDPFGTRVKKYIKQSGLNVTGSCHLFRHAMATHMLENGADVRFVQAILGHVNLNTTEIYTHVAINKLSEIHAATHPAKLIELTPQTDVDATVDADTV